MSVTIYSASPANCLPCCNANANAVAIACRTIGGTASLIGFSEFISPSSPPAKYLKKTLTGSETVNNYGSVNLTCTLGVACYTTQTYSGINSYDLVTGVYTQAATRARGGTCDSPSTISIADVTGYAPAGDTVSLSPTVGTLVADGVCHENAAGPGYLDIKGVSPSAIMTLSDEFTESDAISRLTSSSNYSAWTNVGDGSGGTCLVTSCCKSNYQSRTNFSFAYVESQYRANVNASNSTSYSLIAEIWRAPSGFVNYALYSYQITGFTTNATGFASTVVNVPITKGYATYAANVEYF